MPNRYLDLGHKHFILKSPRDLGRGGRLEEECKRLDKIGPRFFNRSPLACDVQLRRQRHESIVLAFNDDGDTSGFTHSFSLRQIQDTSA